MTTTPVLGLTELETGADGVALYNAAVRYLEKGISTKVTLVDEQTTPPVSPAEGDTYLVLATGTGAWTGQDGDIAMYLNGAWVFFTPYDGLIVYLQDINSLEVFVSASSRRILWSENVTSITNADSPYTVLASDRYIKADATAGAITINLIASANKKGETLDIIKTDASGNTVTADGNGGETINGATTVAISSQYGTLRLFADGSNYLRQ